AGRPDRGLRGKAQRQRSREPERAGRYSEDGEEEEGARAEERPEDADPADRRKPQPVDQGIAHAPERDDAEDEDRCQDRKASRAHAAPPCPGTILLSSRPGRYERLRGVWSESLESPSS